MNELKSKRIVEVSQTRGWGAHSWLLGIQEAGEHTVALPLQKLQPSGIIRGLLVCVCPAQGRVGPPWPHLAPRGPLCLRDGEEASRSPARWGGRNTCGFPAPTLCLPTCLPGATRGPGSPRMSLSWTQEEIELHECRLPRLAPWLLFPRARGGCEQALGGGAPAGALQEDRDLSVAPSAGMHLSSPASGPAAAN